MTREEVLASVPANLSYFNDCKLSFAIQECRLWINKIYDDFESQTCESCKHYSSEYCKIHDEIVPCSLAERVKCDEWEPKEK